MTPCSYCHSTDSTPMCLSPSPPLVDSCYLVCTRKQHHWGEHIACGDTSHDLRRWSRYRYPWGEWSPTRVEVRRWRDGRHRVTLHGQHRQATRMFRFTELGDWLFWVPADVEVELTSTMG